MRKVFSLNKKSLILFFALVIFLSSCNLKQKNEAIEYIKQFERNENIFYVDDVKITTKNKEIVLDDENLLEGNNILFVSDDSIFFKRDSLNKVEICKTDYNCSFATEIYSYEDKDKGRYVYMLNEDKIVYSNDDGKFIYSISSKQLDAYIGDSIFDLNKGNSYYSYEKYDVGKLFEHKNEFHITEKESGITKIINDNILIESPNPVQIKHLNDLVGVKLHKLLIVDKNIYFQCKSENIITTFLYDFASESIKFIDWVQIYDAEYYNTFFEECVEIER